MAYFAPYIDSEGIHIPTYAEIMEYLTEGYKSIFGEDIYLGEDSLDYQMLSIFAKAMDDQMAVVVQNYNARNPNYATGDALDLLIALNAMSRKRATASTVTLKLTGTPATVVPAGSQAIDDQGYIWTLDAAVTLDGNGVGTGSAHCETAGAITANAGTITTIYSPVFGWSEVTNEAVATPGNNVETDAELRIRRNRSVSMNTNGTYDALVRGISALDDVEYVDILINNSKQTDSNGIPGHSFCALVQGGDEDEIAEQIWLNKAPGVGTYGTTTVNYVDSGFQTNVIKFTRPDKVLVSVAITITAFDNYDADRCAPIIKDAVIQGIGKLGVGQEWGVTTAYRDIYNAFANEQIPFVITSISGTNTHGTSSTIVECDFDEILYTDATHVTITIDE